MLTLPGRRETAAVQAGLGDVLEHTVDDVITQLLLVGHTGLEIGGSHFKSLAHASDAGHVLSTCTVAGFLQFRRRSEVGGIPLRTPSLRGR